jgi:hypothetical protein
VGRKELIVIEGLQKVHAAVALAGVVVRLASVGDVFR